MPLPRLLCAGALLAAVAIAAARAPGEVPVAVSSQPRPSPTVSPSTGAKHERFVLAMTSRRATGVFGRTRRAYVAEAHAVRGASGCVNNRDRVFPARPAGARVHAALDPARGEGGPEGWCRGVFRGTVTYTEAFACPPAGTCHPPHGFPTRTLLVARFSFRVR